jgi:hypothetical protein
MLVMNYCGTNMFSLVMDYSLMELMYDIYFIHGLLKDVSVSNGLLYDVYLSHGLL